MSWFASSARNAMLAVGVALAGLLAAPLWAETTSSVVIGDKSKSSVSDNDADFHASFFYHGRTSTLTINLTDTTPHGTQGLLTGFMFDLDRAGYIATLTSASDQNFWDLHTGRRGNRLDSSFGKYEAGAALGGNFARSPVDTGGLTIGQTGVFVFDISGHDSSHLHADDFTNNGMVSAFNNSGAVNVPSMPYSPDDVAGQLSQGGGGPGPTGIPLPPAVWTGFIGLAMAGATLWARRRKAYGV